MAIPTAKSVFQILPFLNSLAIMTRKCLKGQRTCLENEVFTLNIAWIERPRKPQVNPEETSHTSVYISQRQGVQWCDKLAICWHLYALHTNIHLTGKTFIILLWYLCLCLVAQCCPTLCNPMDCSPPGSSAQGDSLGQSTGLGCHAHLQGIFLTQEANPRLWHCRQILYSLSHQGNHYATGWYQLAASYERLLDERMPPKAAT